MPSRRNAVPSRMSSKHATLVISSLTLAMLLTVLDEDRLPTRRHMFNRDFEDLSPLSRYICTCRTINLWLGIRLFVYGKLFGFFPPKLFYAGLISPFEVGSLLRSDARNPGALWYGMTATEMAVDGMFISGILLIMRISKMSGHPAHWFVAAVIFCQAFAPSTLPWIGPMLKDWHSILMSYFSDDVPISPSLRLVFVLLFFTSPPEVADRPASKEETGTHFYSLAGFFTGLGLCGFRLVSSFQLHVGLLGSAAAAGRYDPSESDSQI